MSKMFKISADFVGKESGTMVPVAFYVTADNDIEALNHLYEKCEDVLTAFDLPKENMKIVEAEHYQQKICGKLGEYVVNIIFHSDNMFDVIHDETPKIQVENLPVEHKEWILNNMFAIWEKAQEANEPCHSK